MNFAENYFKLKEQGTSVKTEIIAGVTTFATMAYIIFVNPDILSATGMDKGALFTVTCLVSALATLLMGLWAKLPFALAPGMGLNAFFAFGVVLGMGHSWQFALTAILIEGVIFIILSFFNIRETIVNKMPATLRNAIAVGIGLFIALIGAQNAGIVVNNDATLLGLGSLVSPTAVIAIFGIIASGILLIKKVPGALIIGILLSTIAALFVGVAQAPTGIFSLPPSVAPIAFQFEFHNILTFDMFAIVFAFLLTDIFDTVGTLLGVATKAKMLDENGNLPRVKEALTTDAIATIAGACLGTSTVTTYVESSAGVASGGRTGLTSVVTAVCFLLALFFAPIALMIPSAATAPALIIVGVFMMSPITQINFEAMSDAIPAFLTIAMMPFAYSISDGIGFGIVSYTILNSINKETREKNVNIMLIIVSIVFVIKYLV